MPALRRHKIKPPPDEDEDDSSESGKQPLIEKDYSTYERLKLDSTFMCLFTDGIGHA